MAILEVISRGVGAKDFEKSDGQSALFCTEITWEKSKERYEFKAKAGIGYVEKT